MLTTSLMSRKSFNIILILLLILTAFAVYETLKPTEESPEQKISTHTRSTTSAWPKINNPSETPPLPPATPAATSTTSPVSSAKIAQIQNLQDQLQSEGDRISQLKAQQQQWQQQITTGNPWWARQREQDIQNLSEEINNQRETSRQIDRSIASQQSDQNLQLKSQQDQVDLALQQTAEAIQQTQAQMNAMNFEPPPPSVTVTQQQEQHTALQNNLMALNDQLNTLRLQRVQISAAVAAQSANLQEIQQQQQQDLQDSQSDLQNQIFSARADLQQIENSNQQLRMSLVPLNQQIDQAQKNYQSLQDQLRNLESTVQ